MAVNLNTGGDELVENSDINVTPFIDVMLVLLIIFMVAAPLSTVDAPVDLPISTAKPQPRPDKPVFVTVKSDLSVFVGEKAVAVDRIESVLEETTKQNREQRIFVRADRTVPYGELTRILNALRNAGYFKVALVGLEGSEGGVAASPSTSVSGASK